MEKRIEPAGLTRRELALGAAAWAAGTASARAQSPGAPFEEALAKAIADGDFAYLQSYREKFVVFPDDQARAQGSYRGRRSERLISSPARRLIVACEVTSEANYRTRLQSPIWPKGQSGVTIGIGYDLGYVSAATFRSDWGGLLPKATVDGLAMACGLTGQAAARQVKALRAHSVGWPESNTQFDAHLQYVVGQTEDTFLNCADLRLDSLGALVSLIYNRGASLSRRSDRRREMREIYDLMLKREFAAIPDKIREMKRIWKDDTRARGLLRRRELEALLFEQGLKG